MFLQPVSHHPSLAPFLPLVGVPGSPSSSSKAACESQQLTYVDALDMGPQLCSPFPPAPLRPPPSPIIEPPSCSVQTCTLCDPVQIHGKHMIVSSEVMHPSGCTADVGLCDSAFEVLI